MTAVNFAVSQAALTDRDDTNRFDSARLRIDLLSVMMRENIE